jgi:hypothetical protein
MEIRKAVIICSSLGAFAVAYQSAAALTLIYDSLVTPLAGVSSTDPTTTWGDTIVTNSTGLLDEVKWTIFNSSSSAGALSTASVRLSLFNAANSSLPGSYDANIGFGSGLLPSFYTTITSTGLSGLDINLTTTNLRITQQVLRKT